MWIIIIVQYTNILSKIPFAMFAYICISLNVIQLVFFSPYSLHLPPLCSSVCVWTQLAFNTSGNVHSSWCFFCFFSLWNREVNITKRLQRPSMLVCVCVAGQCVTHICVLFICGSYVGQPPHTITHTQTQTVCPTGNCFLLRRLLPPDCFHHRATGLFLPHCSVHTKLSVSLMLWTTEDACSLSPDTSKPPSTPTLCLISSQSFSSPPEVEVKIRQSPCLCLNKDCLTGLLCHFRQMKIESVIIPCSAMFFHIQIQTRLFTLLCRRLRWCNAWLDKQQQLIW